jgi:membrane protease YdiL (CAAX protease family)
MLPRIDALARLSNAPLWGRILAFLGLLLLILLLLSLVVPLVIPNPTGATIGVMVSFYLLFLLYLQMWGRSVHGIPAVLRHYGMGWNRANGWDLLIGLGLGLAIVALLFGVQGALGWLQWQIDPTEIPALVGEGALLGIAVGIAEELLFRGWLLDEMERDWLPGRAAWGSATVFAILHFLKPLDVILQTLPQFLGLLLLGVVLACAKQRTRQLGLAIGLHSGLVWGYYLVDVGDWVVYGDRISPWITGINNNPLAGAIGSVALVVLWQGIRRYPKPATKDK